MPGILTQLRVGTPAVKEAAVKNLNSLIGSHGDHARLIADEALLSTLVAMLSAAVRAEGWGGGGDLGLGHEAGS